MIEKREFVKLEDVVVLKIKERYSHLHPLLFLRSAERAHNSSDLFDILDTVPQEYPLVWDELQRRWVVANDLFLSKI